MTRLLRAAAVTAATAVAWVLLLPAAPLAQPAFNHARHTGMGCTVCHRGAEAEARAGIPEAAVCLKCHATAPAAIRAASWDDAAKGRPIAWVRVTRLADHVMFSHRRHVGLARLDCTSCHADVGASTSPPGRAPVRLDMDACLGCHRREGAGQDCAGCHR